MEPQCGQIGPSGHNICSRYSRAAASLRKWEAENVSMDATYQIEITALGGQLGPLEVIVFNLDDLVLVADLLVAPELPLQSVPLVPSGNKE